MPSWKLDLCKGMESPWTPGLLPIEHNRNGVLQTETIIPLETWHSYRISSLFKGKSSATGPWIAWPQSPAGNHWSYIGPTSPVDSHCTRLPQWSTLAHSPTQIASLPQEAGWRARCPSRCTCSTSAKTHPQHPGSGVIKHGLPENSTIS